MSVPASEAAGKCGSQRDRGDGLRADSGGQPPVSDNSCSGDPIKSELFEIAQIGRDGGDLMLGQLLCNRHHNS
jgi:hypothetical protein